MTNNYFDWAEGRESQRNVAIDGVGTSPTPVDLNNFTIGDVKIPIDTDLDELAGLMGEAGWLLLQNHEVKDMCVDGRPISNMEMLAVNTFWSQEFRIERWIKSLDDYCKENSPR